jgi:hypothetical protein
MGRVLFNRCGEFRWFSRETILGAMAGCSISLSFYGGLRG